MSNLKCGTKGYSGPTCKEADFPECKEIGGGYNYKKLYRKGAKPTTSKSKYSAKYKQMKSISGNGAFWSANPLATGVCRVASKKNPTRSLEWYAFEPATAPQPAAVPTAPAYTNGVYDSQPEDEGDPTFAERADRMLKDAVKYYDAKFTKLEESDFDPKVMLDNFWKEAIAVAGVIVAAITIKLLRGRSKKRKAALAKEKRLAEKKKARMAEEKARAAEQRMLEAERETIEARKAALDAERKAMEAERASPVPPPPEEPVALTQIKSTSSSPKQAVPELPPPETPAETEAIVLAAPEVKVAQDPAPVVRGGLEVVDWGDGDSPGERETIEMRVSENRASVVIEVSRHASK